MQSQKRSEPSYASSRLATARSLIASYLSLCFQCWHAHCITSCRPQKFLNPANIHQSSKRSMKPTSIKVRNRFPFIDCNYHSGTLRSSSAPCVKTSKSLRDISRDYFDGEANHEFISEAAVFTSLILMAMVPIVTAVSAVLELFRALPLF
jgi:hypothetical protein